MSGTVGDARKRIEEARTRFMHAAQACDVCEVTAPVKDPDETDPMWSELFAEVRAEITYKAGYELLLKPDAAIAGGRWFYQVHAERLDAITGEPGTGRGGKAYLSPHATRSELVQTAFGLFKAFEEHESREFFRWRNTQVFGPHFDVIALSMVAPLTETRKETDR